MIRVYENPTKKLKTAFCKLTQNICKLVHRLGQFPFTTSETELDYYQLKVNIRVAERLKT